MRNFNWPCRLLDIDVGVDAQIEVFENNFSTGDFIPVQIKTKANSDLFKDIKGKDFNYWNQIGYGVLLVLVSIEGEKEPKMYWEFFDSERTSNILEENCNGLRHNLDWHKRIHFNKELTVESKNEILQIFLDPEFVKVEARAKELNELLGEYESFYQGKASEGLVSLNLGDEELLQILFHTNGIFAEMDYIQNAYHFNMEVRRKGVYTQDSIAVFEFVKPFLRRDYCLIVDHYAVDNHPDAFLPHPIHPELKAYISKYYFKPQY